MWIFDQIAGTNQVKKYAHAINAGVGAGRNSETARALARAIARPPGRSAGRYGAVAAAPAIVPVAAGPSLPLDSDRVRREAVKMAIGSVKWFQPDQGVRLHPAEGGGPDVFVHITAVQAAGLTGLNDGQKVSYDVVSERGKMAASNLRTL